MRDNVTENHQNVNGNRNKDFFKIIQKLYLLFSAKELYLDIYNKTKELYFTKK